MLSEHLRPSELTDLIQPKAVIEGLERMVTAGTLRNLLFYGQPGLGKTSAVKILIEQVKADTYCINGSLETGIDTFADTRRVGCLFRRQQALRRGRLIRLKKNWAGE